MVDTGHTHQPSTVDLSLLLIVFGGHFEDLLSRNNCSSALLTLKLTEASLFFLATAFHIIFEQVYSWSTCRNENYVAISKQQVVINLVTDLHGKKEYKITVV